MTDPNTTSDLRGPTFGSKGTASPGYDEVPVPPPLPRGWSVSTAVGLDEGIAERMEYDVFLGAGFCEPCDDTRVAEFEPWRHRSRFKVVLDDDHRVRGTVRFLNGPWTDLPVGQFDVDATLPPDPVLEYASLAVPVGERGTGVAEALYRAVWYEALQAGAGAIVCVAEEWLLGILNGVYGLGFRQLGPSRWYMGGHCFPAAAWVREVLDALEDQPSFRAWVLSEIDLRDPPPQATDAAVVEPRRDGDDTGTGSAG